MAYEDFNTGGFAEVTSSIQSVFKALSSTPVNFNPARKSAILTQLAVHKKQAEDELVKFNQAKNVFSDSKVRMRALADRVNQVKLEVEQMLVSFRDISRSDHSGDKRMYKENISSSAGRLRGMGFKI